MKKRVTNFLILFSIIILLTSIISAGLFDNIWKKITGKATEGTTALNITIGNSAPTIAWVQSISAQDPTDDTTKSITFNFTATDTDGASNLDDGTVNASFSKAGETTRMNTTACTAYTAVGNNKNYSCTIDMWYFDVNGAWTINVSVKDINDAYVENSTTTFTYNLLPGMKMSPTSLGWPSLGLTDTNTGSDEDPILINNTGNDDSVSINVTAYNLQGETTTTDYIYANNFTVEDTSEGCSGTAMSNATSLNVTSAILYKGNHSLNDGTGQEQIYFCLKGVPQEISAQSYSSAVIGAWTIEIVS